MLLDIQEIIRGGRQLSVPAIIKNFYPGSFCFRDFSNKSKYISILSPAKICWYGSDDKKSIFNRKKGCVVTDEEEKTVVKSVKKP